MKTTLALAFASLLASVPAFAGSPATYDTIGTVLGVRGDVVIVRDRSTEPWDYTLDKNAKVKVELKPGTKVTIVYKMISVSIEATGGDRTTKAKAGDRAAAKGAPTVSRAIDDRTGTLVGVKGDVVTLRHGSDKWEFALTNDTRVNTELKPGAKVTIFFRTVAVSVSPWKPPANPYPESGPELSGDRWRSTDRYDSNTVYTRGTLVYEGYSSAPHVQFFRCTQEKCTSGPPGEGWAPAGWE